VQTKDLLEMQLCRWMLITLLYFVSETWLLIYQYMITLSWIFSCSIPFSLGFVSDGWKNYTQSMTCSWLVQPVAKYDWIFQYAEYFKFVWLLFYVV